MISRRELADDLQHSGTNYQGEHVGCGGPVHLIETLPATRLDPAEYGTICGKCGKNDPEIEGEGV